MKPIGVFEALEEFIRKKQDASTRWGIDDIIDIILEYQKLEMDNNLIIAGQNGTGKSWTALAIAKKYLLRSNKPLKIIDEKGIYSDPIIGDTTGKEVSWVRTSLCMGWEDPFRIEMKIRNQKKSIIIPDEAQYWLSYLDFQRKETKSVVRAIEGCRENGNVLLPCIRHPRVLVNTYRNGKCWGTIYLIDRRIEDNTPFGVLLMGNNFIEVEDKFMMEALDNVNTYDELYDTLENLPTFTAYFDVEPNVLTPEEIKEYKEYKELQMRTPTFQRKQQFAQQAIQKQFMQKFLQGGIKDEG